MSIKPQPVLPYDPPGPQSSVPYATPEAALQLMRAQAAWKPLRRAARYATVEAWTLALCAVLSLTPIVSGGGVTGVLLALVLGGVATVEFVAARQLRRLDPAAPRRLALNQLVLGGAVILYAAWNYHLVSIGRGMMAEVNAQSSPQLLDAGFDPKEMVRSTLYALYACLMAVGVLMQGGTALFYASKGPKLRAYLAETPAWLVQMQAKSGSL